MQLAAAAYTQAGGGHEGCKAPHNSLVERPKEDWGTRLGTKSGDTHERYLPKTARGALTDEDYRPTTAAKRRDARRGRQHSWQPPDVAEKAARYRDAGAREPTKAALMAQARRRGIPGRSSSSAPARWR